MAARVGLSRDRILDVAQGLVQCSGYNAFSFADIAEKTNVKTATLHHHFASKEMLVEKLISRYRTAFLEQLTDIERRFRPVSTRLRAYVGLYRSAMGDATRLCPCTILAAEASTLPDSVSSEVNAFIVDNERWIARVLASGARVNRRHMAAAKVFCATVQGAALLSRACGDMTTFELVTKAAVSAAATSNV